MMDRTDRHLRYLLRLLAPHARLYTEMITARALLHGDRRRGCCASILPSIPSRCSSAAAIPASSQLRRSSALRPATTRSISTSAVPSDRVQAGCFGAALMLEPARVAECVARDARRRRRARHRQDAARRRRPRLATSSLRDFIAEVAAAGCTTFIVHARKAWLKRLEPETEPRDPAARLRPRASLEARVSGAAHRDQRRSRRRSRTASRSSRTSTAS